MPSSEWMGSCTRKKDIHRKLETGYVDGIGSPGRLRLLVEAAIVSIVAKISRTTEVLRKCLR